MALPSGIGAVLTDIEGTTTPIDFVYETLFPYARQRLETACSPGGAAVELLRREHAAEDPADPPPSFGTGAPYAAWLMDRDRKSTGLKELQGIIWEAGYRDGTLRSVVFDDVPQALRGWRELGLRLRVFSSGSVLAQRLLFGHTSHGDLTRFFEGYHDTTTGPKREVASYRTIAETFGESPRSVLYLSDVTAELDAARNAGMRTGLLRRPGNPPVESAGHTEHADFLELL